MFDLNGELSSARYCHCSNCVKFAGTSPAVWAMANREELTVKNGSDENSAISKYNSGHGLRCFCSNCGSPVWFESLDFPNILAIPLGVLDEGTAPLPEKHLWIASKPDWCSVKDDLPKFKQGPE